MSRRRCVRLLRKTLCWLAVCGAACVLLGEWMVFYIYSMRWDIAISDRQGENGSLRVLLLADPHIQCTFDRYERWLYRWDADLFLARSFRRLLSATDPGLVVVLGDVFAEGFKASEKQWREYLECFRAVFPIPPGVERIVLYGDNDIGGEGRDVMNEDVLGRYEKEFGDLNAVINVAGRNFVKLDTVNLLASGRSYTEKRVRKEFNTFIETLRQTLPADTTNILLEHIPLHLVRSVQFKESVCSAAKPAAIFSGHIHHVPKEEVFHSAPGWGPIPEYVIPTCSYRMGEMYMGAGFLTISPAGDTHFTYLWLPPRFPFLALYLLLAVLAAIISFCYLCVRRISTP